MVFLNLKKFNCLFLIPQQYIPGSKNEKDVNSNIMQYTHGISHADHAVVKCAQISLSDSFSVSMDMESVNQEIHSQIDKIYQRNIIQERGLFSRRNHCLHHS
jgi:hypothetical protein